MWCARSRIPAKPSHTFLTLLTTAQTHFFLLILWFARVTNIHLNELEQEVHFLYFHLFCFNAAFYVAQKKKKKTTLERISCVFMLFISYSPPFMTDVVKVFTTSLLSCLPLPGPPWNAELDVPPRRGAEFYGRERVRPEPHRINTGVRSVGAWRAISRRTAPWVITGSAAAPHARVLIYCGGRFPRLHRWLGQ